MAEVILDEAGVLARIGEVEAATVPELVWMDVRQTRTLASLSQQVVYGLPSHRCAPLGKEQPGETVVASA